MSNEFYYFFCSFTMFSSENINPFKTIFMNISFSIKSKNNKIIKGIDGHIFNKNNRNSNFSLKLFDVLCFSSALQFIWHGPTAFSVGKFNHFPCVLFTLFLFVYAILQGTLLFTYLLPKRKFAPQSVCRQRNWFGKDEKKFISINICSFYSLLFPFFIPKNTNSLNTIWTKIRLKCLNGFLLSL